MPLWREEMNIDAVIDGINTWQTTYNALVDAMADAAQGDDEAEFERAVQAVRNMRKAAGW